MPIGQTLKLWATHIKRDGLALWFASKHAATPWYAKGLGILIVAYALSPIDLIPDFIPVLGFLDDVLLLPGLIWITVKLVPPNVLAECRAQAQAWMQSNRAKPVSRWGAALVVMVWALVGFYIWTLLVNHRIL
jgi:uncharacterized membrane protein YkvA (DUF1232 family)